MNKEVEKEFKGAKDHLGNFDETLKSLQEDPAKAAGYLAVRRDLREKLGFLAVARYFWKKISPGKKDG